MTLIFTMFVRSRFVLLSIMKTNLSEHMVAKKTELLALPGKARCIKQSSTCLSLCPSVCPVIRPAVVYSRFAAQCCVATVIPY